MSLIDLSRTTTARLLGVYGAFFALWSLLLIGLIQWDTSRFLSNRVDQTLQLRADYLAAVEHASLPEAMQMIVASDRRDVMSVGLFDASGRNLAGNLQHIPADLVVDGRVHDLRESVVLAGEQHDTPARGVARKLPSGELLIVQRASNLVDEVDDILLRSLLLGLSLVLIPGVVGGYLLGRAPLRRVRAIEAAVQPIMRGNLRQRLPLSPRRDELDLLAGIVNTMLAEIERLMGEVKGVCDSVAHDLRTPLTRLRAQLHRLEQEIGPRHAPLLEQCIADADALLLRFRALLRISEIEDMQRRAGFTEVDLAPTVRQVHEFYAPLAEDRHIQFSIDTPDALPPVHADAHLVFEALSNLVDNAIKFTPPGGSVHLHAGVAEGAAFFEIADSGAGIGSEERRTIMQRCQRGAAARGIPGHGLGLAIVAAVVHLHGFSLAIGDNQPQGTRVVLDCRRRAMD